MLAKERGSPRDGAAGSNADVAAPLDLSRHVPARLLSLSSRIALHATRASARPNGLSIREWRIIQILGWLGSCTVNAVAAQVAMDGGGTSRAIAALEARMLVRRVSDENDGRVSHVALTEAGVRLHDELVHFARQREELLLSGLSLRERQELNRLLGKLEHQASKMLGSD